MPLTLQRVGSGGSGGGSGGGTAAATAGRRTRCHAGPGADWVVTLACKRAERALQAWETPVHRWRWRRGGPHTASRCHRCRQYNKWTGAREEAARGCSGGRWPQPATKRAPRPQKLLKTESRDRWERAGGQRAGLCGMPGAAAPARRQGHHRPTNSRGSCRRRCPSNFSCVSMLMHRYMQRSKLWQSASKWYARQDQGTSRQQAGRVHPQAPVQLHRSRGAAAAPGLHQSAPIT